MEKEPEAIKQIIENSQSAALLLEENAEEEVFLAKESLRTALLQKGLALISLPEIHPRYSAKWAPLAAVNNLPVPQKVSIRIPKDKYPIKELQYDENDKFFSLLITTQAKNFDKEALIFEKALPKAEAAFCFLKDREELENFRSSLELPPEENIVFLKPGLKGPGQNVFEMISDLGLPEESFKTSHLSTLLLAALTLETNHFSKKTSPELFRAAAFLIEHNADQKTIKELLTKEKDAAFWQIAGRALARTAFDSASRSSWTFLAKKDFEKTKTQADPVFLSQILKEINRVIPAQTFSLILWQGWAEEKEAETAGSNSKNQIWALVSSSEQEKLKMLANNFGVRLENGSFKTGPFNNFSEAEIQIRRLLKTAL